MNPLQQVIKQRMDEFEKEKMKKYTVTGNGSIIRVVEIGKVKSHNQETVEAVLEAVKGEFERFDYKCGKHKRFTDLLDSTLQDIKKQNNE